MGDEGRKRTPRQQRVSDLLFFHVTSENIAFGGISSSLTQYLLHLFSFHKYIFPALFPFPPSFPFSLLSQYREANNIVLQLRINSKLWFHCCSSRCCIDPHLDPGSSGILHHATQCALISVLEKIGKYFGCTGKSIGD